MDAKTRSFSSDNQTGFELLMSLRNIHVHVSYSYRQIAEFCNGNQKLYKALPWAERAFILKHKFIQFFASSVFS